MTPHIWAIDTPWAKKGDLVITKRNLIQGFYLDYSYVFRRETVQNLLELGWIKPVEEKRDGHFVCGYSPEVNKTEKLTAEEILKQIMGPAAYEGSYEINPYKLAALLAEHLK